MKDEDLRIKQYLLQNLPENEMTELDLKIIKNEDFSETILIAEDELIEEYLENNLSKEEKVLFQNKFLTSERRRENLTFTASLKKVANTDSPKRKSRVSTVFPVWKEPRTISLYFKSALAFGALLIIGSVIWQTDVFTQVNPLAKELITLNKEDLNNLNAYQSNSLITLAPNGFRSEGDSVFFSKAGLTETTFFRLALKDGFSPKKMRLRRNNIEVFSIPELEIYQNQVGSEVRLLIPARILTTATYEILLGEDTENASYRFEIR